MIYEIAKWLGILILGFLLVGGVSAMILSGDISQEEDEQLLKDKFNEE